MVLIKQFAYAMWRLFDGDTQFLIKRQAYHNRVVIIGGYCGLMAQRYAQEGKAVLMYEPIKRYAQSAKHRCIGLPVLVRNFALGAENRVSQFSVDGEESEENTYNKCVDTEVCRVKDCAKELKNHNGLLYINCEGAEYEIIPRLCETGVIDNFETLLIQFHYGSRNKQSLKRQLKRTHRLVWNFYGIWEEWKRR